MKGLPKKIFSSIAVFMGKKLNRRILYLVLIILVALGEFLLSALVRRTYVFYSFIEGDTVVENRMLPRAPDRETDIRRYVEDALLGPESPDSAPLFPRETRLNAFMFREGEVFADLTEDAALPFQGEGDVFRGLLTLNEGIRRNFPYVKNVRLFIGGNEVFFKEFHGIFTDPADNSKTAL